MLFLTVLTVESDARGDGLLYRPAFLFPLSRKCVMKSNEVPFLLIHVVGIVLCCSMVRVMRPFPNRLSYFLSFGDRCMEHIS